MNWTEIILSLIINLAATVVLYLLVPVIYCIKNVHLTEKEIKKIIIINAVCVWILCTILQFCFVGESKASGAVLLWSWVGYKIMERRLCLTNIPKKAQIPKTDSPSSKQENLSNNDDIATTQSQRSYIYATAANGINVRIPAEKYDEWKEEQDNIRRGKKVETDPETVERLAALMKGETTESPTAQNPSTPQDCYNEKEQKIMNILTSKRIAAVIAIVLCITLYFALMTTAFTTKRDTYICYTTKTGECFHSATCKYLNTAYETTVYEASKEYKVCKYCNPCIEDYKTTFTSRDYITPLLISLPISALTFVILTYKKKPY